MTAFGRALLLFFGLVILLITWAPFRFAWPGEVSIFWQPELMDVLLNVVMFLPFGFVLSLSMPAKHPSRAILVALMISGLASLGIELGQLFLPERYTSPWDVLTNGLGGGLGAAVHLLIARRLAKAVPGILALEIPLMNVVYLLTLLVWLDGLAASGQGSRALLAWPLGICGVLIITEILIRRIGPDVAPWKAGALGAGWFLLADAPAFLAEPLVPSVGAAFLGGLSFGLMVRANRARALRRDRRFELATLRRVTPFFVGYLLLEALWPLNGGWGSITVDFHLAGMGDDAPIPKVFGSLEQAMAFVVAGFAAAEARGRLEESASSAVLRSTLLIGGVGLLLVVLRGARCDHHLSLFQAGIVVFAAALGGMLYRCQLMVLKSWFARQ